jgi:hypothetical protein
MPEEKSSTNEVKATKQSTPDVKTNTPSTTGGGNGVKSPATSSVNATKPPVGPPSSKLGNTLSLGLGYASSDDED